MCMQLLVLTLDMPLTDTKLVALLADRSQSVGDFSPSASPEAVVGHSAVDIQWSRADGVPRRTQPGRPNLRSQVITEAYSLNVHIKVPL